jgi:hypothetical protein
MNVFEYASGLISIVIGLAVARVLGGIGSFSTASQRSAHDWIVASWCLALLLVLVGWWFQGWNLFRERTEIDFATVLIWIVATSLLYLAAYVLVPGATSGETSDVRSSLHPLRRSFYFFIAAHFGLGILISLPTTDFQRVGGFVLIAMLVLVSALGAVAKSNQAKALHLVIWLAMTAVLLGGFLPSIG